MAPSPNDLASVPEDAAAKASAPTAEPLKSTSPPNTQPPAGYKFVKVRKADGSIATVKRKLTAEEAAEAGINLENTPSTPTTQSFKIVTVRKPDGSYVKVKRAVTNGNEESVSKSATEAAKGGPPKAPPAGASTSRSLETCEPALAPEGPPVDPRSLEAALIEQKQYQRARKMHRFKVSLARGLGTVVAGALPSIHIGELHDGDEIVSDSDISDDDDMDNTHGTGHDEHDNHSNADDDLEKGHSHTNDAGSHGHFTFDGGKASGGVASALAATAAGAPPSRAPPAYVADGAKGSEKVTFKVTTQELNSIEQQAAEKEAERSLQRHWANFSFYFMASLSIVLPALFLLLSAFVLGMRGKRTDSNWSKMEDAIKFGISAWPIVFAAVTSQGLKSWATYKVEKGVRLLQLEQLVGSNSFGSAMKQPFLLRRLDILSLFIFAIWCLSPIGSQALQRSYSVTQNIRTEQVEIYYLDMNGDNELWGIGTSNLTSQETADYQQIVATDYIGNFAPDPATSSDAYDRYDRPLVSFPTLGEDNYTDLVAGYGVPLAFPNQTVPFSNKTDDPSYEQYNFTMTTSYFAFDCSDWFVQTHEELWNSSDPFYMFSNLETMAMAFTLSDDVDTSENAEGGFDGIYFASLNKAPEIHVSGTDRTENTTVADNADYSVIQCSLKQVYMDTDVLCYRDISYGTVSCERQNLSRITPASQSSKFKGTALRDFSFEWTYTGTPDSFYLPSTPSEMYLDDTGKQDGFSTVWYNSALNLSADTTEAEFETRFAYLFNTWVGLGYCTLCESISDIYLTDQPWNNVDVVSYYTKINATLEYSKDLVYTISAPWVAGFITCTSLLLFAGIASVVVESMTVAPDTLGYVSSVARNSRYLHLPKTNSAMSGGERARQLGNVKVMMQDVKANADVGKIALGLKHENAQRLQAGRLYR